MMNGIELLWITVISIEEAVNVKGNVLVASVILVDAIVKMNVCPLSMLFDRAPPVMTAEKDVEATSVNVKLAEVTTPLTVSETVPRLAKADAGRVRVTLDPAMIGRLVVRVMVVEVDVAPIVAFVAQVVEQKLVVVDEVMVSRKGRKEDEEIVELACPNSV